MMPAKAQPPCTLCGSQKVFLDDTTEKIAPCDICGERFEADTVCENGHYICPMCRQKAAREAIIAHCLASEHTQPYPLLLELMRLPAVAMHGPEHHVLLPAALLTAYCREKHLLDKLPDFLAESNARSMTVPGGACGFWGICGAAIGGGIYMSIVTETQPLAGKPWKVTGQLTAQCADAISREGGPRCCKRDSFLALQTAAEYSNAMLDTHFDLPANAKCGFYMNNAECKRAACPFFPTKT